jgi:hypothetical protein
MTRGCGTPSRRIRERAASSGHDTWVRCTERARNDGFERYFVVFCPLDDHHPRFAPTRWTPSHVRAHSTTTTPGSRPLDGPHHTFAPTQRPPPQLRAHSTTTTPGSRLLEGPHHTFAPARRTSTPNPARSTSASAATAAAARCASRRSPRGALTAAQTTSPPTARLR